MTDRGWLQAWADDVAADPENRHIGRFSRFAVRLRDDEGGDVLLRYAGGTVELGAAGDDAAADIELHGPRGAWRELLDACPAPRRHDLLSLLKAPDGLVLSTDREVVIRHLRVLNRLVELGRARGC